MRTYVPATSYLATQAATLSAGQCRLLSTGLLGSTLIFSSEGANMIQWGGSMYHDTLRNEIGYIGKRDSSSYPYHWLVYDIATNAWSNSRAVWSTANVSGHGYDHNAFDPDTGRVYHREYGADYLHYWDGSTWSTTAAWSGTETIVGGLCHFPGVGMVTNDGSMLRKYAGGAWSNLFTMPAPADSYHDIIEYNASANVVVFGGGNSSDYRKMTSGEVISTIATPPYTLGTSASGPQAFLVSAPGSDQYLAWDYGTLGWRQYDVSADAWTTLTQSSGDGSSPQTGLPNLASGTASSVVHVALETLGVVLFVQYRGSGSTPADVWIYKHA
ncbi:MAG: hypothetical protein E6Q97_24675 [Desulfurellales bacterium]|nr:MAG: hypothetical protein E6Q97_24675 [Desulfurellales bacterium]